MSSSLRVVRDDIHQEPLDEFISEIEAGTIATLPYDRLMIYYRKQKKYGEEIRIIKKGIAALKKFYSQQQKRLSKRKNRGSVSILSNKIAKSTGLVDRKGNELYLPDPLPRWIKRLETAEKKLAKENSSVKKEKPKGKEKQKKKQKAK